MVLSFRTNKLIRWLRPPQPVLNLNARKVARLLDETLEAGGRVLDIGSGGRRLRAGILNLDIDAFDNVHVVADAHHLPFIDQSFDLIVASAVLEHVPFPNQVVAQIEKCLKPGGLVYAEIPFLQGFHSDPHDYQRYTLSGIKTLFRDYIEIDSGVCSGPASTITWYLRKFPTIFFSTTVINKTLEFFTGWLVFPFKYLDYILIKQKNAHSLASGLYFIGRTKSG